MQKITIGAPFIALLFALTVQAEQPCNCSAGDWIDDCQAQVKLMGDWYKVSSDTPRCSRVDWYIDGIPQITVVLNGVERESRLNLTNTPEVVVQSCVVCKDSYNSNIGREKSSIDWVPGPVSKQNAVRTTKDNLPDGLKTKDLNAQTSYSWPNGNKYQGEFKNGKMHGQGTYTWPNGNQYQGEFRRGKMHGHGNFLWPSGKRYEGGFKDGKMHGQGVVISPNGERNEGEWRKNKCCY
jgi:hypothetical protein